MAVLVLVLAALAVFAIAAAVIGREARRLDAVAPRVVYALDDLKAWADRGAVTSTSDPRGSVLPAKRHGPAPVQAGRGRR